MQLPNVTCADVYLAVFPLFRPIDMYFIGKQYAGWNLTHPPPKKNKQKKHTHTAISSRFATLEIVTIAPHTLTCSYIKQWNTIETLQFCHMANVGAFLVPFIMWTGWIRLHYYSLTVSLPIYNLYVDHQISRSDVNRVYMWCRLGLSRLLPEKVLDGRIITRLYTCGPCFAIYGKSLEIRWVSATCGCVQKRALEVAM